MLIPREKLQGILAGYGITPTGVLHVGAHDCEELKYQEGMGIAPDRVVWVEAIPEKVEAARARGVPNVVQAVVAETDGREVEFKVTNNVQSSSILEFGVLKKYQPGIDYVRSFHATTCQLDTLFAGAEIKSAAGATDAAGIESTAAAADMWNFDIQGAELMALQGGEQLLANPAVRVLQLEVNREPIYAGCALIDELDAWLLERGFRRVATQWTFAEWGDAVQIREPPRAHVAGVTWL